MTKKIFIGFALVAGLWSCTEDYTDWATPQQNTAKEAAQKLELMLQPTLQSIDFATYTAETVQLFTSNLTAEQAEVYTIDITGGESDKVVTLEANAEGYVKTSDLTDAVTTLFGKAPTERALTLSVSTVATNATADGNVNVKRAAAPFALKAKLDAPYLETAYYYIGTNGTGQTYQFTNATGKSFYDDPEISVVIPASTEAWHWFRIAGISSFGDDGNINWDKENANTTSICPETKDDESTEGKCINGTMSWHLIQSDDFASYRITVNLLDMTYSIKGISAIPEYYGVGTMTSWNANEKVCTMFPASGNTLTLTTYFTGAWDIRMWPAENFGNWDKGKAIGTAVNGDNAAAGTLCWNNDNDGNLASPEAGFYTLDCDLSNMTYKWTKYEGPITTYDKIGLVGGNDDWDNDIFLTQVENNTDGTTTHLWYALGVTIDHCTWGVKFRANGSWDVKDWGKGSQEFPFAQSNSGDNIPFVPGTYNVYFNDINGHYFFVAQ